ncbi:hypothetical protein [Streptomyces sp. NPDC000410]|uniref:hypothetical protein n=1 Tax=Streptomyces sp. NPDC000410 TaxID=3154254 RepID=UPI00332F61AD
MVTVIVHLFGSLLRLLLPPSGRHRSLGAAAPRLSGARPVTAAMRSGTVLRGEDSRLVRPYLVEHEHREQERAQRQRRRALWLAVHGIDVGPRLIHGVEVAS